MLNRRGRGAKFTPNTRTGSQKIRAAEVTVEETQCNSSVNDANEPVTQNNSSEPHSTICAPDETLLDERNETLSLPVPTPTNSFLLSFKQRQTSTPTTTTSTAFKSSESGIHDSNIKELNTAVYMPTVVNPTLAIAQYHASRKRSNPFVHDTTHPESMKKTGAIKAVQHLLRKGIHNSSIMQSLNFRSRAGGKCENMSSSSYSLDPHIPQWAPVKTQTGPSPLEPTGTDSLSTDTSNNVCRDKYQRAFIPRQAHLSIPDSPQTSSEESRLLSVGSLKVLQSRSTNRSEGRGAVNGLGNTFKYFTAYIKRRKTGLGLRLVNQNQRAVVAGFSPEYLKHAADQTAMSEGGCVILPGDIIMAVENLDTSDPVRCNFDRVIQHLSKAGCARSAPVGISHPQHVASTTCIWDEDPLNLYHRTSSLATYNDTVCIQFARPSCPSMARALDQGVVNYRREGVLPGEEGRGVHLLHPDGLVSGLNSKGRRYAFGIGGNGVLGARMGHKDATDDEDEGGMADVDTFNIRFNYEI